MGGRRKQPQVYKCETCKQEFKSFWNRDPRWCSVRCRDRSPKYKLWRQKYEKSVLGKIVRRKSILKNRHEMTIEQEIELLKSQEGHCAICPEIKGLELDHYSLTGEVRGLLCDRHNRGIGFFSDNPREVFYLLKYLLKH